LTLTTAFFCAPIKINFDYFPLSLRIRWHFMNFRLESADDGMDASIWIFKKKIPLEKKTDKKETAQGEAKKEKKPKKITTKWTFDDIIDLTTQKKTKKILYLVIRFLKRMIRSVSIKNLKLEMGIDDYYFQGIVHGLLYSMPETRHFRVRSNFDQKNEFHLTLKVSLPRIYKAILAFLLFFPYLHAYKLYKRVG
ncbi:MAG: hypothetical protein OEY59_00005, partial [Deltaproteobacteria bacterium]|nr:hypothetical protein [Deltaproteobacteria bacterium]